MAGFDLAQLSAFLETPLGAAVLVVVVIAADRYAPPWVSKLIGLFVKAKPSPAAQLVADQAAELNAAVGAIAPGVELVDLVRIVGESAEHRYPAVHPAEALDRYLVDLRSTNYYHRDQARKAGDAAAAPTAAEPSLAEVERYG